MIPDRLSHYRVIRRIGAGGMGEVWLAEDVVLGRRVAIKVLPAKIANDPGFVARFRREARAISALNHPNILTIHEYDEDAGLHFFVTEYLAGRTVRDVIRGGATPAEAIAAGVAIASALAVAHAAGVIHRDIKPENVIISDTGLVKVLDFGLAKAAHDDPDDELTRERSLLGTLPYMSPEQASGSDVGAATDVFSLGVTLYELFEAHRPFDAPSRQEVVTNILLREPAALVHARSVSPRLPALILRMLSKEQDLRPVAAEVLRELESIRADLSRQGERPVSSSPDAPTEEMDGEHAVGNLPAEVTALIGRDQEVAAIVALLRSNEARLVTITGPGGCGKSRLALRVAAQYARETHHGAWFVPLEAVSSPDHVAGAIAQVLGVPATGLADHLRKRRLLLLIDNFEQVIDAAPLIASLLSAAPQLRILVTSQLPLHIAAEHVYSIDPLALDPAVSLFVARAKQVRAQFELTGENAAAVAEICRLVDGLPLAIELAAVRVRLLTPAQIVERLRDPIAFLTGGGRDLPPRQRALSGTVEWSVALLDEAEKQFFARLAIFHGGATLEAADKVVGPASEEVLASLVDKNLVRRDGERFTMLAGIRSVASRQLDASGLRDGLAARHAELYAELVESIEPQLIGSAQPFALRRLAAEQNDIRAATEWALASGRIDLALRLGSGMWRFWDVRGFWREGRDTLGRILRVAGGADARLRAKACYAAGVLADAQRDYASAYASFCDYLALARMSGDPWTTANALNNLAIAELRMQRYDVAWAHQSESIELWRGLGNETAVALALQNLASIAHLRGEPEKVREHLAGALAIFRRIGDPRGTAHALMRVGAFDRDAAPYEEALQIFMGLTDHYNVAACMAEYAGLMREKGDLQEARSLLEESAVIFHEIGDLRNMAMILEGLACGALDASEEERAQRLAGAAHAIRESIGAWDIADRRLEELRGKPAWNEGLRLSARIAGELAR